MNDLELWKEFCFIKNVNPSTPYEAWKFGGNPNKLLDLVIKGIKTATSSAYDLYSYTKEKLPKVGDFSVILNDNDEALCILQTVKLTIVPFLEVSDEHAYKEGERDKSLRSWREIHKEFFQNEYQGYPIKFTDQSNILCEEFTLLYVAKSYQ